MKKLIATLLVLALAVPAMAVDISLVDNMDGTGTIVYTAAPGEVVRGIGLTLTTDGANIATTATAVNAEFNVFMDSAYAAEMAAAGSYVIGAGSPLADAAAAGEYAVAGTTASVSMGVLDESGNQGGASAGVEIALLTIAVDADCVVTIVADALRGGIVGDDLVAGTIVGGPITMGGDEGCAGDADGNGVINGLDLSAIVGYLHPAYAPGYSAPVVAGMENYDVDGSGMVDGLDLSALVGFLHPAYAPGYEAPAGVCVGQ